MSVASASRAAAGSFLTTSLSPCPAVKLPPSWYSGIGKTTLLRLIGGQIPPGEGEILFDGENIPAMSRSRLYTVRKRMSMLFQSGALFTDMNVFDNVAYPLREHTRLPPALLKSTVMMKLEAVGLRGAAKLMPSELSGGMAAGRRWRARLRWNPI